MLSDNDIKTKYKDDQGFVISSYNDDSVTTGGYDLRVGKWYYSFEMNNVTKNLEDGQEIHILPQDTLFVETLESVQLPVNMGGTLHGVVSVTGVRGLSNLSTSVAPGWQGKLLIQVHNLLKRETTLRVGEPFCTLCLHETASPSSGKIAHNNAGSEELKEILEKESKKKPLWRDPLFHHKMFLGFLTLSGIGLIVLNSFEKNLLALLPSSLLLLTGIYSLFLDKIYEKQAKNK